MSSIWGFGRFFLTEKHSKQKKIQKKFKKKINKTSQMDQKMHQAVSKKRPKPPMLDIPFATKTLGRLLKTK
jgi:hypothetical protein